MLNDYLCQLPILVFGVINNFKKLKSNSGATEIYDLMKNAKFLITRIVQKLSYISALWPIQICSVS